MKVYAIKDLKIGFEPPFTRQNDDVAIREFESAAKFAQGANRFRECPTDYELWSLGEYDMNTGVITSKPEYLSNLLGVFTSKKSKKIKADVGENENA